MGRALFTISQDYTPIVPPQIPVITLLDVNNVSKEEQVAGYQHYRMQCSESSCFPG